MSCNCEYFSLTDFYFISSLKSNIIVLFQFLRPSLTTYIHTLQFTKYITIHKWGSKWHLVSYWCTESCANSINLMSVSDSIEKLSFQTTTLIGLLKTARLLRLVRVARKIDRYIPPDHPHPSWCDTQVLGVWGRSPDPADECLRLGGPLAGLHLVCHRVCWEVRPQGSHWLAGGAGQRDWPALHCQ